MKWELHPLTPPSLSLGWLLMKHYLCLKYHYHHNLVRSEHTGAHTQHLHAQPLVGATVCVQALMLARYKGTHKEYTQIIGWSIWPVTRRSHPGVGDNCSFTTSGMMSMCESVSVCEMCVCVCVWETINNPAIEKVYTCVKTLIGANTSNDSVVSGGKTGHHS